MKHFLCLVLSVLALAMLPGCKSNPVDSATGEPIQVAPPTMEEVKALVYASTRLAFSKWGPQQSAEDLLAVQRSLEGVKVAMSAALSVEEPDLTKVRLDALEDVDPEIAALLDLTLGIVVGRVRPFIDQQQTEKAVEYMEAGMDGALLALATYGPTL